MDGATLKTGVLVSTGRILGPLLLLLLLQAASGWRLVLKAPHGAVWPDGVTGLHQLWLSNTSVNEGDGHAESLTDTTLWYKSGILMDWQNSSISLVRVSLYKEGLEKAYVVFSTAGPAYNHSDWPVFAKETNETTWFDCGRILDSSWTDLLDNATSPGVCSFNRNTPLGLTVAMLEGPVPSQVSDCASTTGWFYVQEQGASGTTVNCSGVWPGTGTLPQFMYVSGNMSGPLSGAVSADLLAVFVDDCVNGSMCPGHSCWQNLGGQCYCDKYHCSARCSQLPCSNHSTCVVDEEDELKYTCDCDYGYYGDQCQYPWDRSNAASYSLPTGTVVGLCVMAFLILVIAAGVMWCFYIWKHRDEEYGGRMVQRAVMARNFVRRSFRRLSGKGSGPPRRQMRDDSPKTARTVKSAEQLEPASSSVFGASNPAFMADDLAPTPPPDRRYTEFPTAQGGQQPHSKPHTLEAIRLEERQSKYDRYNTTPQVSNDSNVPYSRRDRKVVEGQGQFDLEAASSMSEVSSASGHSDRHFENAPANLPPSEMISKDISGPGRPGQRPHPRAHYPDAPRRPAPRLSGYQGKPASDGDGGRDNVMREPRHHAPNRNNDKVFSCDDVQEASV